VLLCVTSLAGLIGWSLGGGARWRGWRRRGQGWRAAALVPWTRTSGENQEKQEQDKLDMEKQRGGEASARRRFGAAVSGMADRSCSSDLCSNWCDGGADRARQKKTATGCADAWRCAGDGKAAAGAELRLATPVRPKRQRRAGLAGDTPPLPRGSPLRPPSACSPAPGRWRRGADADAAAHAIIAAGRACSAVVSCDT
jgi:hypothetical protein